MLLIFKARLCLVVLIQTRQVQGSAEDRMFEPGHKCAKPVPLIEKGDTSIDAIDSQGEARLSSVDPNPSRPR